MRNKKCLMMLSPLEMPTHPYASVPQLVTWLRANGRPTDALDLNLEFFWWLIEKNEEKSLFAAAWEELKDLNAREKLAGEEAWRFASLYRIFQFLDYLSLVPDKAFFEKGKYRSLYLMTANMFPPLAVPLKKDGANESISYEYATVKYRGDANYASSASLVASIEKGSILDEFFEDFLSKRILHEDYLFVGISVPFFSQCEPAMRLARAIKRMNPGVHICLGGNYVGLHLSHTENPDVFKYIDSLSVGDGEIPLLELGGELESPCPDMGRVSGLVYLEGGKVRRNPRGSFVPLDQIPVPDEIFDRSRYFNPAGDSFIRIRFSEGCSWGRCAFCNLAGCGLFPLQRPDENKMFEKIRTLVNRGEKILYLGDDESDIDALERFAKRVIAEGLVFMWETNIRFSPGVTLEWAMLMRQAGCNGLAIGLENYDDRLLRHIEKGTSVALIDQCLENLAWAGVPVMAYMMVGLPTESEEEARRSFGRLIEKVRGGYIKSVFYSLYAVSRDSPIDRNPGKYGVTLPPQDPELDLRPGYGVFEHSGMSHKKAVELQLEFTEKIAEVNATLHFTEKQGQYLFVKEGSPRSAENAPVPGMISWQGESLILRGDAEGISLKTYDPGALTKLRIIKDQEISLDG